MATLREMRRHFNMTQRQMAKALRCDVTAVSCWETGKRKPIGQNISRIAKLFNISEGEADALFSEEVFQRWHLIYARQMDSEEDTFVALCSDSEEAAMFLPDRKHPDKGYFNTYAVVVATPRGRVPRITLTRKRQTA